METPIPKAEQGDGGALEMSVVKRNGKREDVSFDKILKREKVSETKPPIVLNYSQLVMEVIDQLYSGIPTSVIDDLHGTMRFVVYQTS